MVYRSKGSKAASKLGNKRSRKKPKVEDDAPATLVATADDVTGPDYKDHSDSEDDDDDESFEFNETPADENLDFLAERSEPLLGESVTRLCVAFLFVTQHDAAGRRWRRPNLE
jgi:hypothetical protein